MDAACTFVMSRAEGGGLPVLLEPLTRPVQPESARLHAPRKTTAIESRLSRLHFDECVIISFTFFPYACASVRRGFERVPQASRAYWAHLLRVTGRKHQKRVVVLTAARPVRRDNGGREEEQVKNSDVRLARDGGPRLRHPDANLTAPRARGGISLGALGFSGKSKSPEFRRVQIN